ncbi:MAG: hypothetical protein ACK587_06060 [Cyanobacteriota bacterium]
MDEPGAPPMEAQGPALPTMAPPSASTAGQPLLRSVTITPGRPRHRVRLAKVWL